MEPKCTRHPEDHAAKGEMGAHKTHGSNWCPLMLCAAQVYKRQSNKKAQLIFWDEQDKNSHEEFNANLQLIDIYLDEEEESN